MPETLSILSTKSLRAGARDLAQSMGWILREEDFIETSGIPGLLPEMNPNTLVIFTSENGVKYLVHGVKDLSLHRQDIPGKSFSPGHLDLWRIACLAGKTKESVLMYFREEQVIGTAGNAKELAAAIIADGHFKEAVFFCALEHRPELPAALRQASVRVTEIPVYKTTAQPKAINTPYDGVLFFSPSGVESFFQLNHLPKGAVCFAIGETTAGAIKDYTDERIIVSDTPAQADLLRCVQFYYDNQQCYNEPTTE
jgi:uroporphyrinogen-III synthase